MACIRVEEPDAAVRDVVADDVPRDVEAETDGWDVAVEPDETVRDACRVFLAVQVSRYRVDAVACFHVADDFLD